MKNISSNKQQRGQLSVHIDMMSLHLKTESLVFVKRGLGCVRGEKIMAQTTTPSPANKRS